MQGRLPHDPHELLQGDRAVTVRVEQLQGDSCLGQVTINFRHFCRVQGKLKYLEGSFIEGVRYTETALECLELCEGNPAVPALVQHPGWRMISFWSTLNRQNNIATKSI